MVRFGVPVAMLYTAIGYGVDFRCRVPSGETTVLRGSVDGYCNPNSNAGVFDSGSTVSISKNIDRSRTCSA